MSALIDDIRYGLRMSLQNPGPTLVAVLALGFGIGANSAIFSVVNGILLRPLPYKDSGRLVVVWETKLSKGVKQDHVTPPNYRAWTEQNRVFDQIGALRVEPHALNGGELSERIETALISPSGFDLLGVQAALGRTFTQQESQPGHNHVAVLSYGLWQRRFGGDREVLGKSAIIDGASYTIVGVTPPEFRLLDTPSELWIPYALDAGELKQRGIHSLRVIAHLKPGVTLDQAQSEMGSIARRLEQQDPEANTGYSTSVVPLRAQLVGDVATTLWTLLAAVVSVLLIACADVANLLLARAGGREKEITVRAALGANRWRVARQLLTESMLLALTGGLLGLFLALWVIALLKQMGPATLPRLQEITVDGRVLAFTMVVSIATGLIFGLAPALATARNDLNSVLRASGRGSTSSRTRARVRDTLVIGEIVFCAVLLSAAGLLIRSFARLQSVNPGFRPDHVLTLQLSLPENRYSNLQVGLFYKLLIERLGSLPGVQVAGITREAPLSGGQDSSLNFTIENRPVETSAEQPRAKYRAASAGYFAALGIPLIRGRYFDQTDGQSTPGVVVINETMARRFWKNENPIGKRIKSGFEDSEWSTIVGIIADVKHTGLDSATSPETYYHYLQVPPQWMGFVEGTMTLVLHATADPVLLASAVRGEVQNLDRNLAIFDVQTMESVVRGSLTQARFRTTLLGAFAGLALFLAAIGLYGVIAYSVTQRTNELGVRMALGAQKRDVLRLILGHGTILALIGIAIGLSIALGTMRVLSKLLFGVTATDPVSFAAAAALILMVAVLASLVPALRAMKVDPMVALRYE
jgi:putative ABC transport system permease protein